MFIIFKVGKSWGKVKFKYLGLLLIFFASLLHSEQNVHVNKPGVDFTAKDVNGNNVTLSSYKGKVVLLNFWMTFCLPCREEMPSMEVLFNEYKSKGFEVLTVSADSEVSLVNDFIKEKELTFTMLMDTEMEVADKYNVVILPTSFMIDKNGIIRKFYLGANHWTDKQTIKFVEMLLAENPK